MLLSSPQEEIKLVNSKVLIVAGDYVPVSSNTTFRALGFAEELPELGWEPVILTHSPQQSTWTLDEGLTTTHTVHRVRGKELVWRVLKKITSSNARLIPESIMTDKARSWIPFAVSKGVGLVMRHRIPVVFGSFQPWSSLVAAYLIARTTGRPLIAEFRDPILRVLGTGEAAKRRVDLARKIALHADRCVATTQEIADDISELADGKLKSPPLVLKHGFRKVDLKTGQIPPFSSKFILTFTGSLYGHECLKTLCEGASDLEKANPELAGKIVIRIVGREKGEAIATLKKYAADAGLNDNQIEVFPWASQEELRSLIAESHVVWLTDTLAGSGEGVIIPGKLAKMFACGRPVLALCRPDGATCRAVDETGAGEPFDYTDREGVRIFLSKIYAIAAKGGDAFTRNETALEAYSFRSLTGKLASAFTAAASK